MIDNIQSTLEAGFDPQALEKINIDTQERLNTLQESLYSGPSPESFYPKVEPFIPKDLNTDDLLFSSRNNIKIDDLINSDDPDKQKIYWDYMNNKALNSEALKYNLSDYVYQTNPTMNKLKDFGFGYDITKEAVENEDKAYKLDKDSHWWITNAAKSLGKGIIRLPGQMILTAAKVGAKLAAVYDYILKDGEDRSLLTAIGDNFMVRTIQDLDERYKESFLSSLKSSEYDKSGFFKKMGMSQFWTDDAVDFVSYLLISRGVGGFLSKSLGGVGGTLGKVLNAKIPGKIGGIVEFFGGARNISGLTSWVANTYNEALDETTNQYKQIGDDLRGKTNPITNRTYTPEEIHDKQSKAASLVFKGNLAILSLSNGLENRWIQRAIGKEFLDKSLKDIIIKENGEAISKLFKSPLLKTIAGNQIGSRFLYYGPEIVEGLLREGYWEENAQTAITRLSDRLYGKGFYTRIGNDGREYDETLTTSGNNFLDFFKQLGKQTSDASTWLGGEGDVEVATSIGTGGLISVGGTVVSNKIALSKRYDENTDEYKFKIFKSERKDRENRKIKAINEINNARENFLSFKDVFDSEGNIDRIKLISKLQKFEDLQNRFDATEDVENPVIKKDLQERLFSELVLAHLNNGTFEQFIDRFGNKTPEELSSFGFTPDLIGNPEELKIFANKLSEEYKKIQNLEFGNKEGLEPERFNNYQSLLKSRLFQLHSNGIINQNTLNRMNEYLKEKYEDVIPILVQYDNFEKQYSELEKLEDKDGSLLTQKDIIKEQLKDLQDEIGIRMDDLEKRKGNHISINFNSDIQQLENIKSYQEKLNKESEKYLNDLSKSVSTFRDEYNAYNKLEEKEEKTKKGEEVKDEEKVEKKEEESEIQKKEEEVDKKVEDLKKEYIKNGKSEKEAEDLAEKDLSEEDKEVLNNRNKEELNKKRDSEIRSEIDSINNSNELFDYFNTLSKEEQDRNVTYFDSKILSLNVDSEELTPEEDTVEERFSGSNMPYRTILKTSSKDTDDISPIEEVLKNNEYDKFRIFFMETTNIEQDILDLGYYFSLEMDNFEEGNVSNLSKEEFEKVKSVVIVLKNNKGENIKISELTDEFQSIKDKNVIFQIDNPYREGYKEKWKEKANIKFDREGAPVDITLKQYEEEAKLLTKAFELVKKGESVRISPLSITLPAILQTDKNNKIIYRTLSNINNINIKGRKVEVSLENGIILTAYPKSISSSPIIFDRIKEVLEKEYDTKESAENIRNIFLNRVMRSTFDRRFIVKELPNKKFKIYPIIIKDGEEMNDESVLSGKRSLNVSIEGLKGNLRFYENSEPITKEEYIKLLQNSFETPYKIIYEEDLKTQYLGKISSYLEFIFDDPKVISLSQQRDKNVDTLKEKIKGKFKEKNLIPVGQAYFYNGVFVPRVSSIKEKLDVVYGTQYANRGTLIDSVFREFLSKDFKREDFREFFLNERRKIIAKGLPIDEFLNDTIDNLYDNFNIFKNHNPNLLYITDIPTFIGKIQGKDFSGTIDILAIDKTTNDIFIIDLKTQNKSRINDYKNNGYYKKGDSIQLNAYAELIEQSTGLKIKGMYIFPINIKQKGNAYTEAFLEDKDNILLPVERVPLESIAKIPNEEPKGKYNYKFKGEITYNGIKIPIEKSYIIYSIINDYIKDYFIDVSRNYIEDPDIGIYPIIRILGNMGIELTNQEDKNSLKEYFEKLKNSVKGELKNFQNIEPDFESIHREENPDFKEDEVENKKEEEIIKKPNEEKEEDDEKNYPPMVDLRGEDLVREMVNGKMITDFTPFEQELINRVSSERKKEIQKEEEELNTQEVENPIEEEKNETFKEIKLHDNDNLEEISLNIDGKFITFDEVSGEITEDGNKFIISRNTLKVLFESYNNKDGAVKINNSTIDSKLGIYEVFSLKRSTQDKGSNINTSYIFNPEGELVGTLEDLDINGGIIIDKKDFTDNTESDILNALSKNC